MSLNINEKALSIVLIFIGNHQLVSNTIISLLGKYRGLKRFAVPINPIDYWCNWRNNYGCRKLVKQ